MFFRAVRPKRDAAIAVTLAHVHLPVRLGHRDARAVFARPLAERMAVLASGTVCACDTREAAPGDIVGVDLHVGLRDPSRAGLAGVARLLEALSAPLGSSIRLADGGEPLLFGSAEGLEVAVETARAPDPESRRAIARACAEALKGAAVFRGWALRPHGTVLYFYGASLGDMQARIAGSLPEHGLILRRMA